MDVARQAYPNVLFLVIAVSGIVIAEAIMLFFRMVEVGEANPTPALWLLTMVLLIVFSSISYARVIGADFNPARVSDQQLWLAVAGAVVAVVAALALRLSVIKLELVARQHVHDNAVMNMLDDLRENQNEHLDLYEFTTFPEPTSSKSDDAKEAEADTLAPDKKVEISKPDEKPQPPKELAEPGTEVVRIRRDANKDKESRAEVEKAAAEELKAVEPDKTTDTAKTESSKSENPRLKRRSAGTRIKKPRSKDAKT